MVWNIKPRISEEIYKVTQNWQFPLHKTLDSFTLTQTIFVKHYEDIFVGKDKEHGQIFYLQ